MDEPSPASQLPRILPGGASASTQPDIGRLTREMEALSEEAFTRFHQLYYDRLLRYLIVVTRGDVELSRDLLQAVFSKVVRAIHPFDTEPALWNWLATIARNQFIDTIRKTKRAPQIIPLFADETLPEPCEPPSSEDPLHQSLDHCLSQLPPDERVLIESVYFERHSQETIAQEHQSTRKAVESKLARIRSKLRQALLQHLRHEHT